MREEEMETFSSGI